MYNNGYGNLTKDIKGPKLIVTIYQGAISLNTIQSASINTSVLLLSRCEKNTSASTSTTLFQSRWGPGSFYPIPIFSVESSNANVYNISNCILY